MSEQYAEYKCIKCSTVTTVSGMKVIYGPDDRETGQCLGDRSSNWSHSWLKIKTYTR